MDYISHNVFGINLMTGLFEKIKKIVIDNLNRVIRCRLGAIHK